MASPRAIIGKIPGYNSNIDSGHKFEQELKKGLTYIDLYPTSYTDILEMTEAVGNSAGISDTIKFFGEQLSELFTRPGLVKSRKGAIAGDPSYKLFTSVLSRMATDFDLGSNFASVKSLRIVAANDSTFTETFSNSFDAENVIVSGFESAKNKFNSIPFASSITKGIKSFDSMAMSQFVGGIHKTVSGQIANSSGLADLLSGAALGMNIAAPKIWSASQYNSTLTLFVKLISPTGQNECIRKNILEPLLYLIAASSPVTGYGIVYGYPLLWQVHAHGITNFRVGSIAALSIIRGSFETTFTKALQPTVVDVRLTIIPLLNDFAVQTSFADTGAPSIYADGQSEYLGVQNPADIRRGTMNTGPIGSANEAADTTKPNIISVKI